MFGWRAWTCHFRLAGRRPQSLEIECLRCPFDDDSPGRIAQAIAMRRDLLAPAVGISDLYAVIADVRPYHPSAAPQGVEVSLHLRIRAPIFLFATIVVAATWPGVPLPGPELPPLDPELLPDPELPLEPLPDPELPPEPLPGVAPLAFSLRRVSSSSASAIPNTSEALINRVVAWTTKAARNGEGNPVFRLHPAVASSPACVRLPGLTVGLSCEPRRGACSFLAEFQMPRQRLV